MTRTAPGDRSHCPIAFALDLFGDQWTLLIVRDLILSGKDTYQDFLASGEGMATNVLADRLRRLEDGGIVVRIADPTDARRVRYLLTERGIDLFPMLLAMIDWSSRHDVLTLATPELVAAVKKGRRSIVAGLKRRLREARQSASAPTPRRDSRRREA